MKRWPALVACLVLVQVPSAAADEECGTSLEQYRGTFIGADDMYAVSVTFDGENATTDMTELDSEEPDTTTGTGAVVLIETDLLWDVFGELYFTGSEPTCDEDGLVDEFVAYSTAEETYAMTRVYG